MMGYATETCRAKDTSINYTVASSWHFTLFHDEDARSNNPQLTFSAFSVLFTAMGEREWPYIWVSDGISHYIA